MRLHRLKVTNFAGIGEADIAFGPGLNVLFGPNDLGKSTLADAIRLALLLPHASTHCEPYVPWAGGGDPVVDLTFSTDEQRFWRVRKEFGKSGSSVLQESRNGKDFDDVERARRVDAKLREILRWGLPEPGGTGAGKGLPTSFLATALLSTQAEVTAVLEAGLQNDPTGSGKERIAAALQAVAQDPLFVSLLRETQARRDEAFTEKGAKKTAKGSVFKAAADRLKETRDEKVRLQKLVEESEGVELHLAALVEERIKGEEGRARAAAQLADVELLASQAAAQAEAADRLRAATAAVRRIEELVEKVAGAERNLGELADESKAAVSARDEARAAEDKAADLLKEAEEEARSAESQAHMAETVAKQELELRKSKAERAAAEAQQAIVAATDAQRFVDEATAAERELEAQTLEAERSRASAAQLGAKLKAAQEQLGRYDVLECGLALRLAEAEVARCDADLAARNTLQEQLTRLTMDHEALIARRTAIIAPDAAQLGPMRRLATELGTARGVLNVGLLVTVTPTRPPLQIRVGRDGVAGGQEVIAQPLDAEAATELEVQVGDVATVHVRGGRRDARENARMLEDRWAQEVAPHLAAAGVEDLEALDAKVVEALDLDAKITSSRRDTDTLRERLAPLEGAAAAREAAMTRLGEARAALVGVDLRTLAADLDALGNDPAAALRARRQRASDDVEAARATANQAATARALADDRVRTSRERFDAAATARDAAIARFPSGLATVAEAAQVAFRAANTELQTVTADLASLQGTIDARSRRLENAVSSARDAAARVRIALEAAEVEHTKALTAHAAAAGGLAELRRQLATEDRVGAENAVRAAAEALAALPVPTRPLAAGELEAAHGFVARAKRELDETDREIQRTQGALEQVGGAVARERLRDAVEAFELAERHERELEADYEAWRMLLDQMKEADAAQASNLGQALAPAIASHFEVLTAQRYQGVQLTDQLGTEGVVLGGVVRSPQRISVGTREQLSTLYRVCLGEYLRTAIVLDDQLVQSDGTRMDWFRGLLAGKARSFQIVVFTCRPDDYLASAALPNGDAVHADMEDGFVRALDLGRAVRRR